VRNIVRKTTRLVSMDKIFKRLFDRMRRESVEDTSEIDVIARGVSNSGQRFAQMESSQDPGAMYDDSSQTSVKTTDMRKKYRRL